MELLIAMAILSIILVMSTVVLIQVGNLYSKGVNAANLQNASRTIAADIASSLQFSGAAPQICAAPAQDDPTCPNQSTSKTIQGDPPGSPLPIYSVCIGTTRYSYALNRELGTDSANGFITPHVLWRDTLNNSNDLCSPLDLTQSTPTDGSSKGDGYEMAPAHTRLGRFKVTRVAGTSNIHTVDVWMDYGDSDLLNIATDGSATCQGGQGTQFCSTSQISTTLTGRLY